VLDFEPHIALFVPDKNPLLFYERIADIAIESLKPDGKLYFEINREKGGAIVEMLRQKGFIDIELRKDISGNERMIRAKNLQYNE
jgi:release factor glutamine methyltransferase